MWKTALKFMTYEKMKLVGIMMGIVISIFLIGAQLGILNNILDISLGIVKGNEKYIYVVDKKSTSSMTLVGVDMRVGYELQSIPNVDKVFPVIVTGGTSKYKSGATAVASIIGVQYPEMAGAPEKFTPETNLANLQNEGAVIVDKNDLENMENIKVGEYFYLNNIRVFVGGLSINNPGLGQQNIITTVERARQLSGFNANQVSAYLIKSATSDTLLQHKIVEQINQTIPNVKAYTGKKFAEITTEYNKTSSGIVIPFYMMIVFSLFTGIIIVGLTMFSSVNDHIRDYGTIKAIGGSNYLIGKLIIRQAMLYAVISFLVSMGLLFGLQYAMSFAGQTLVFSVGMLFALLGITVMMSLVGSSFSMRKIFKLEPVQIFRM